MCGIVGVANLNGEPVVSRVLQEMTDAIAHRGPDSEGHYLDRNIGLGHRRLAIIDLSPAGHQPMANEDGDVIVTFNGEIYNFQKLRIELEAKGHQFHSRTDTEVIVHAWEEWGPRCLDRFNGMYAFGLYDRKSRKVFLARDRYGIKPLYWWHAAGVFLFASEIKAILQHPGVDRQLCPPALNEYFTFQNILSDLTLFEGIRLLPPGCSLTLDLSAGAKPVIQRYWDYRFEPDEALSSLEECADRVHELLTHSVSRQLVSDVPIGSYLSGGMDSASLTAIASRHLHRLTTFTCGFDLTSASGLELSFDERPAAEILANLFKTEHYEVVLHAGDMEWVLPELIWHLEDPRVGQCYPNYYVSRLASKFVKVVLGGTGGDELFAGYPWRYYPGLISSGREDYFRQYYASWQRLVPDEDKARLFRPEINRALGGHSTYDVFRSVFQLWPGQLDSPEDCVNASLYFELKTFLHGLLVVEDKLSMAHALEGRVPFLDNDLVDFALKLPLRHKLAQLSGVQRLDENALGKRQRSDGKAVLRQATRRLIPDEIRNRTKQGFSAPDASWFRGESIDYINRLLRNPKSPLGEFINPDYVADMLDQHCSGSTNRRLLIWSLLSLHWWIDQFLEGKKSPYAHHRPSPHNHSGATQRRPGNSTGRDRGRSDHAA